MQGTQQREDGVPPVSGQGVVHECIVAVTGAAECAGQRSSSDNVVPRLCGQLYSMAPDGVAAEDGTDQFTVAGDMLRRIPCR